MTARILFVDDEPDLEPLILQKFRKQIRDGAVSFLFAFAAPAHERRVCSRTFEPGPSPRRPTTP